ncbi:efflux RND transporter periplasmic adaptor subunit [Streptococcus sp. X16XC17]|uniref:efflux RND transporter periplasmic adaptor subunit n=1 Tax=unclassified Streptococcus TaxID=2608887 RepID=UPI00066FE941|nr:MULTISPECIES: efflux RND transporter periplasmic adaptor subunit [unclassified Streptococcus]TCD46109.1 efflux RND transporter periplasmic adaptor subunit [Streptococcus sp. X16XC17]
MFQSKKEKIALFSSLGVAGAALVGGALLFGGNATPSDTDASVMPLTYHVAKEGSIASSTLLAGTVSAAQEQYVCYDSSKGDISEVKVKQGDQVQVGQALVQYDVTELQANVDTAVRGRDKIGRQIHDLRTNGQTVDLTGDASTDNSAVSSAQRTVDMQLQDLNDAYADAQAAVDKAVSAVNEATVTSNVAGTVVEVHQDISKSNTSTNQTVVHIVNQGSLQVTGSLTEYDLANIAVDQEVKITSKVYPEQTWTGKINYISNYPEGEQPSSSAGGSAPSGSKYPFKATLTSEAGPLKQGFTVNIEVVNNTKHILVPVTAVVTEDDKNFVWTIVDGKAKKVEVTLGNSDATNQEITAGLKADDHVISIPMDSLKDGQEVEANEETVN